MPESGIVPHASELLPTIAATMLHRDVVGSAWFRRCVGRQMLVLLVDGGATPRHELLQRVPTYLHAQLASDQLAEALDDLVADQLVVRRGDTLEATVAGRNRVAQLREQSKVGEDRLRERYLSFLAAEVGALPHGDLWTPARDEILVVAALQGPKALLSMAETAGPVPVFTNYLRRVLNSDGISERMVQRALNQATETDDTAVTRYLASLHGAAMFRAGLEAPPEARDIVAGAIGELHLLLDTNVLFSVLGVHRNPANAAAVALCKAVADADEGVVIGYLAESLAEARQAIAAAREELVDDLGIEALSPAVAAGMLERRELYGLIAGFAEFAARQQSAVDPRVYFGDLSNHLATRLEQVGLVQIEGLQRPDLSQDDRRLKRLTAAEIHGRRKTVRQREHDYVLREVCCIKRGRDVRSLGRAAWWVVSADWEFLAWDRHAARTDGELQCVLHVAAAFGLVNILSGRSSPDIERAAAAAVEHPLLYTEYDNDAEEMLIRVAARVNRLHEFAPDDASLLSEVFVTEIFDGLIQPGRGQSSDGGSIEDNAIDEAAKAAFSQVLGRRASSEEALRARVAELEQQQTKAAPPPTDRRTPKRKRHAKPKDVAHTQGSSSANVSAKTTRSVERKRIQELEVELAREREDTRVLVRRSIPVWVLTVSVLVAGAFIARALWGQSWKRILIVGSAFAVMGATWGVRLGPERWGQSRLGRFARRPLSFLTGFAASLLAAIVLD